MCRRKTALIIKIVMVELVYVSLLSAPEYIFFNVTEKVILRALLLGLEQLYKRKITLLITIAIPSLV